MRLTDFFGLDRLMNRTRQFSALLPLATTLSFGDIALAQTATNPKSANEQKPKVELSSNESVPKRSTAESISQNIAAEDPYKKNSRRNHQKSN